MKLKEEKKHYDKKTKNLIKYTFIFTIMLLITLYVLGKYILLLQGVEEFRLVRYIDGANFILALISVPCCFLYYKIYKNEEFFILTLSYVSILLEYTFVNMCFQADNFSLYTMIAPFLFRCLFLILAMKNKSKISQLIVKGKYISIISALILNILGLYAEIYVRELLGTNFLFKYFPIINIAIIILYFILLILLFKRCFIKGEFIYMIFILSICLFTLRRLFFEYTYDDIFMKAMGYNKILSLLGFLVLLIGLYVEVLRRIEISEILDNEVKKNKQLISTITENIEDFIITTDIYGKIIYINKSALDKLGYKKENVMGTDYKKIITHTCIENEIENEGGDIVFINYKLRGKNGEELKTQAVVTNILDDNSNALGKIIVARDCAIIDKLDSINRKYNAIKETENIRNQFFANISHEFKTPINIIYSCLQLLDMKKGQSSFALLESYDKYRENIKQNCHRMLRLVNNLVDITKIDSGFMNLEFSNHDIVSLVENVVLSVVPYVHNNNINIVFDTFIEEVEIKCDADSIERIVLNLLSNAIKFTDKDGNIFVDIDGNKKWIIIKVRDNGIGIQDEFKDIIFDRFVQGDKSLNRKKEGSGIGLALVKSLVEFHSGTIEINKEYKNGSEFIVKLPNVKIHEKKPKRKNIIDGNGKEIIEKINIEFSDIYELCN
ncbi:MAG: PAS domain-containing sensor histidine kinase [Clostridium perfringens]|nr:PAS domain-containing sensor histidine kinase [Clostridium perfringens]